MPQTRQWGVFSLPQALCFSMQLGCIVIHPRMYELSRVHGFCTSSFSFEVWLHHSTNVHIHVYITALTTMSCDGMGMGHLIFLVVHFLAFLS